MVILLPVYLLSILVFLKMVRRQLREKKFNFLNPSLIISFLIFGVFTFLLLALLLATD